MLSPIFALVSRLLLKVAEIAFRAYHELSFLLNVYETEAELNAPGNGTISTLPAFLKQSHDYNGLLTNLLASIYAAILLALIKNPSS